ncbi:MAG TPA: hypothetical protein VD735_02180 [Candidatus Saccharimonadales bacterium]|nr:hypothetical protein [Candidatus Saccharimonadales bacterium]
MSDVMERAPLPYKLPEAGPMWTEADFDALRKDGILMPAGCGDDRWPHGGVQFFGGQYGLALAYGAGMNMKNGGFDAASGGIARAVDQLAVITEIALETRGILGLNHESCAAALGMKAIALTGVELPGMTPEEERSAARQRKAALAHVAEFSDMSEDRFDQVSDSLAYMAIKHVRDAGVSQPTMTPPEGNAWERNERGLLVPIKGGIPRVPIGDLKHEAGIVAINDDPRHTFDAMASWQLGGKAYHVSMGHLERVHDAMGTFMGRSAAEYQSMRDAVAVFTAKTILNLPLAEPNMPLGVQYLQRVQHA